ncbi:tRNA 2-selenouridine synthase [Hasllibacter halocynthiae]|uniref:tRNA 2-selenouridine synthase n=1 Tax=Hasllibacter halocynthiae TaxID=595589 RepID=A0A2T0X9D8_9RHOB|nr:tRNA 2-selenouridine(34) synthase MnmH [Hasllibacter halocynthiae]PRY95474.1 tRNA 2-selenouridine synthase [Hasllibacter halocynthiae]
MPLERWTLEGIDPLASGAFDDVIDVRSPSEFAEDHLPGAISLPAMSDAERAEVGTLYTRVDRFRARRVGAAWLSRNAARHLEGPLADRDGGWRPLVYCWRGGQRSGAFAVILSEVGWRVSVVEGGYRAWRRRVQGMLYEAALPVRPVVLDGNTGTAKTDILAEVARRGGQVLDLEGLANHRGSVLGAREGGQPGQKAFEGRLAVALSRMDPARPVLVEAESSKVGDIAVPPSLWKAMREAPRIRIEAAPEVRAAYLARAYRDLTADLPALEGRLGQLRRIAGGEAVERWTALARTGAFEPLALELIERHYDPRYARGAMRRDARPFGTAALRGAGPGDVAETAGAVMRMLEEGGARP